MTTALRSSLHGLGIEDEDTLTLDPREDAGDRIIVGIDFGTTHSAIAWAHTSTPEEYEVITQWPGQTNKDWGKVPSDISYTQPTRSPTPSSTPIAAENRDSSTSSSRSRAASPDRSRDSNPGYKWGFEVSPTDPSKLSWIKILLDPSQPRPNFVNPKKTTLPKGKKPVDIVTDYLCALRNYTLLTLRRRMGEDVMKTTKIEYVLTVPAVWSDKARQMTLEAAIRAGLGSGNDGDEEGDLNHGGFLRLITEPEGAAEYALRSIRPNTMKVGDCFTVCDAGGGTVDLISYRINSLVPLQLSEVAIGTGALCGAVYLDRRFEDFMTAKLGKESFSGLSHRAKFQMMQYWETYMKREFTADGPPDDDANSTTSEAEDDEDEARHDFDDRNEEDEADGVGEFWVPVMGVGDNEDIGLRGGFLRVTRKEVAAIFEPIVAQVLDLISGQTRRITATGQPVAAILLVGGFGSSEYLYRRIRKWSHEKIAVMQPRNAWTAVVRGAIIRGLQGDIAAVQSRLSRRFYGVVHDARYEPSKHEERERKWHELRCEWVVRNRIQWYIRRGDITTDRKKISFPFYRTISDTDVIGGTHALRTELWVCDEEIAPDKRDDKVRKLCVMSSDPVPVERFTTHTNKEGQKFYRVDYSLDMTVTGGVVVYEMTLEGKNGPENIGRVMVKYE